MAHNGWPQSSVEKVAASSRNAIVGGPFGSDLVSADYVPSGVPVIRGQNLSGSRWVGGDFVFVTSDKAESLRGNNAQPGDIIFTQRGNAVLSGGQVAIIPPSSYDRYLVSQSQMKLTVDQSKADPLFLYYVFQSSDHHEYLRNNAIITGVPHTNLAILRNYHFPLPPLSEQRMIARALGNLDDKIELNRRMNETLESMARALFRSWFIDFDPVRAKAAGRKPPGLDATTANLFPNRLVDSLLGPIPDGWRVVSWGGIATLEYGKSLRNYAEGKRQFRVYGTNGPIGWHDEFLSAGPGIVIGRKGAYRGVHFSPDSFFVIDTAFYLKPIEPIDLRWAYFELLRCDINGMDSGSAIPSTSRPDFYAMPVCLPSADVLTAFGRLTKSLYDRLYANEGENQTLAATRDALLPKLLSGELRVGA